MNKYFKCFIISIILYCNINEPLSKNKQKTHRNLASKTTFRGKNIIHDYHHRQFRSLNFLTSIFFPRSTAQAIASSHYDNHHSFARVEGVLSDLSTKIDGFPFQKGILKEIVLFEATNNRVFAVFEEFENQIYELRNSEISLFAETPSSSKIIKLTAAGGLISAILDDQKSIITWNENGENLSTITKQDFIKDIDLNEEGSGSIYIALSSIIDKHQADGTLLDTFPKAFNFGNISGEINTLDTHDSSGNIYLTNKFESTRRIDVFSPEGEPLVSTSYSSILDRRGAIAKNNKLFQLGQNFGNTFVMVRVMDFTDINNPIEGVYLLGDPPILGGTQKFDVSDTRLAAIVNGVTVGSPAVFVWDNLTPSTFPSGGLSNHELDYTDAIYSIAPDPGSIFTDVSISENVLFIAGTDSNNANFIKSYNANNGSFISNLQTFAFADLLSLQSSNDNAYITLNQSNSVYKLSTNTPELIATAPANITKLIITSQYIAANHSGNTIEIWDIAGNFLQSINPGQATSDFGINDNQGGSLYIALSNTGTYEKYKISDGSQLSTPVPFSETISQVQVSAATDTGNPLLYIASNDNKKVTSIASDTGIIQGSALFPNSIDNMVSLKLNNSDLLYLAFGSNIQIFNGGSDSNLQNPSVSIATNFIVNHLTVTNNGNVFASSGDSLISGWTNNGQELENSPFFLPGKVSSLASENELYAFHKVNAIE